MAQPISSEPLRKEKSLQTRSMKEGSQGNPEQPMSMQRSTLRLHRMKGLLAWEGEALDLKW